MLGQQGDVLLCHAPVPPYTVKAAYQHHIYRHKPVSFNEANEMIDRYIHFYNHERIQTKTGVAPLTLRHSA